MNNPNRIRNAMKSKVCIVDVDGSYLYRKQQQLNFQQLSDLHVPCVPLSGWETVTDTNMKDKCVHIPRVTPGSLFI